MDGYLNQIKPVPIDVPIAVYANGDPINFVDPWGRDYSMTYPQAGWDPAVRKIVNSSEYQQGFQDGMRSGGVIGMSIVIGGTVAYFTGGYAVPYLASLGTSLGLTTAGTTTLTVVGSGVIGGVSGDIASQTFEVGVGARSSYDPVQSLISGGIGGSLGYGVNRLMSSELITGIIGIKKLGNMGEEYVAQQFKAEGRSLAAEQLRVRTPDGDPVIDILTKDSSTASGFRGTEVKVTYKDPMTKLTDPQIGGYPHVESGNAIPYGTVAKGLKLDGKALLPTPIDIRRVFPSQFLYLSPEESAMFGFGGDKFIQIDPTGKYFKPSPLL